MSSYAVGIFGYCLLFAALVVLGLLSMRPGARVATIGRMMTSARNTRFGRVLLVLAWGWVGWHLFVR